MSVRTASWEAELWSYLSQGNGMLCPLRDNCRMLKNGSWCPAEHLEQINLLLESKRVSATSYSFVECGACDRIFPVVGKLAKKYLELGKVSCPPVPTGIISLFDLKNAIEVHALPLKTCHGAIWHLRDRWIIQLRSGDTSAMKRFVLFHEAFHVLAHEKTTPVFKKCGIPQGSFNELLADYFATAILLPEEWVKQEWMKLHDLNRMVKIFKVPKPLMCIRLRRFGLT